MPCLWVNMTYLRFSLVYNILPFSINGLGTDTWKHPSSEQLLKHLLNVLHRGGFKHTLMGFQNSSGVPGLIPERIKLHVSLTFLSCSHKKEDLTDQFQLQWLAKDIGLEMKPMASLMLETWCKSYRALAELWYMLSEEMATVLLSIEDWSTCGFFPGSCYIPIIKRTKMNSLRFYKSVRTQKETLWFKRQNFSKEKLVILVFENI